MALMRVGVGVGEASLSPSAYSLIADYFPKEKLGSGHCLLRDGEFVWARDWPM